LIHKNTKALSEPKSYCRNRVGVYYSWFKTRWYIMI